MNSKLFLGPEWVEHAFRKVAAPPCYRSWGARRPSWRDSRSAFPFQFHNPRGIRLSLLFSDTEPPHLAASTLTFSNNSSVGSPDRRGTDLALLAFEHGTPIAPVGVLCFWLAPRLERPPQKVI